MNKCKDMPKDGSMGVITYSLTGLTSENINNGISAIDLTGTTASMSGTVSQDGTPLPINDSTGTPITGASLVVEGTYTCA